jgi:hypothetical protein
MVSEQTTDDLPCQYLAYVSSPTPPTAGCDRCGRSKDQIHTCVYGMQERLRASPASPPPEEKGT